MLLFSKENRVACRKTDHQTSQDAADALNAVDAVTKQEAEVLAALVNYGPCTAKKLGVYMAYETYYHPHGPLTLDIVEKILRVSGMPHRRLSAMVADGTVIVEERDGKRVYRSVK